MCEDTVDEVAGHIVGALGAIVEGGDCRKDNGASFGSESHIAQMDAI